MHGKLLGSTRCLVAGSDGQLHVPALRHPCDWSGQHHTIRLASSHTQQSHSSPEPLLHGRELVRQQHQPRLGRRVWLSTILISILHSNRQPRSFACCCVRKRLRQSTISSSWSCTLSMRSRVAQSSATSAARTVLFAKRRHTHAHVQLSLISSALYRPANARCFHPVLVLLAASGCRTVA